MVAWKSMFPHYPLRVHSILFYLVFSYILDQILHRYSLNIDRLMAFIILYTAKTSIKARNLTFEVKPTTILALYRLYWTVLMQLMSPDRASVRCWTDLIKAAATLHDSTDLDCLVGASPLWPCHTVSGFHMTGPILEVTTDKLYFTV